MKAFNQLKPILEKTKKLMPGVVFHQEPFRIKQRFTNLYWFKIDSSKYKFKVKSYIKPRPLVKYNLRGRRVIAGINFGSFYLSEQGETTVANFCNLLIRNGTILQFPCNTRTAVINENGKIDIAKVEAYGTLLINGQRLKWKGSQHKEESIDNAFYGYFDVRLGNETKKKLNLGFINSDKEIRCQINELLLGFIKKNNEVVIGKITGNELNLKDYLFVLKGPRSKLSKLGLEQKIEAFTIGDKKLVSKVKNVCSANFMLGKTARELVRNLKTELVFSEDDGPKPLDKNYIKSWSVILKEGNNIIFFINDARPKYKDQKGLDVFELQSLLAKKFNYSWGVVGDSGQSGKLFYNNNIKKIFGNLHYLNFETTPPYWDGLRGRFIPTAILAYE
jgi:hypothetical protein